MGDAKAPITQSHRMGAGRRTLQPCHVEMAMPHIKMNAVHTLAMAATCHSARKTVRTRKAQISV
jgi:hypothetical protein